MHFSPKYLQGKIWKLYYLVKILWKLYYLVKILWKLYHLVKILFRHICSASSKSIRVNMFSQDPLKLHIARLGGERFRPSIKTLIILEVGERGSSWSTGRQRGCRRETTREKKEEDYEEGLRDREMWVGDRLRRYIHNNRGDRVMYSG